MKKSVFPVVLGILLIIILSNFLYIGFFKNTQPLLKQENKLQITTSFYPLYFFASQIGGDKANVINLTPAGAEPHEYELNTRDIGVIGKSEILIINGADFEPWADKLKKNLKNGKTKIISVAEQTAVKKIIEEKGFIRDPHVWLDPVLVKQVVIKIAQSFAESDPQNQSFYETNSKNLEVKLNVLDQHFKQGLSRCSKKNFITSHNAFAYIASRYGLKQVPIAGLSPDQEPSPKELAEVAKFAKEHNIAYIFFETLISPRLSETIAKEVSVQTLVLDPIEGITSEEQRAGRDYFSVQQDNLQNLRIALQCQ